MIIEHKVIRLIMIVLDYKEIVLNEQTAVELLVINIVEIKLVLYFIMMNCSQK